MTTNITYNELDANILSLVKALNNYPALTTIGSCGGHEVITNPSQWKAGTFYVKFDIEQSPVGWRVGDRGGRALRGLP